MHAVVPSEGTKGGTLVERVDHCPTRDPEPCISGEPKLPDDAGVDTNSAGEISGFSGEFLDGDLEMSFLRSNHLTRVRHLRVVGMTAAVFIVLGVVVDVLVVGHDPTLIGAIIAGRVLVAVMIVAAVVAADRSAARERSLDTLMAGPVMLVSAMTCVIIWAIKGELLLHSLTALVLVLVYYLFLPLRLRWALGLSLIFTVFFILSTSVFLDIRADEFIQVVLYLTLANVLGALVSRERQITLRHEYLVVESERRTADSLRAEVARRTEIEQALVESENRFRSLVELSPDAILVHRGGTILYLNPVGSRLMGAREPGQLVGRSFLEFVLPEYRQPIIERIAMLEGGADALLPIELTVRTLTGRERPCEVVSGPILYGGETAIQSVVRDIADRKQMREELTRLATTDPLTGIANRRRFFECLELEWSRGRRHSRPLSILMFDLDHFKKINDTHGHAVGDSVLKGLCAEANKILRSEDIFARLGGEEFAVILPEIDRKTAEAVAERLRQGLAAVEVAAPEGVIRCTISIGVIQCRLAQESLDVALKRVDDELYRAKRSGRNLVCAG